MKRFLLPMTILALAFAGLLYTPSQAQAQYYTSYYGPAYGPVRYPVLRPRYAVNYPYYPRQYTSYYGPTYVSPASFYYPTTSYYRPSYYYPPVAPVYVAPQIIVVP